MTGLSLHIEIEDLIVKRQLEVHFDARGQGYVVPVDEDPDEGKCLRALTQVINRWGRLHGRIKWVNGEDVFWWVEGTKVRIEGGTTLYFQPRGAVWTDRRQGAVNISMPSTWLGQPSFADGTLPRIRYVTDERITGRYREDGDGYP